MITQKKYYLYVLYEEKSKRPIYIGLSCNLKKRINQHRKTKVFDAVALIESFDKKDEGLIAERALIKFFSLFKNENIVNCLYARFSCDTAQVLNFNNKINQIDKGLFDKNKSL